MACSTGISPRVTLELHSVPTWSCNVHRLKTPESQVGLSNDFSIRSKKGKTPKQKFRESSIYCYSRTNLVEYESNESSRASETIDLNAFQSLSSIPLKEFRMSDFQLCSSVSVGHAGRGGEVVYEAIVQNPNSPLQGSKVVLRQLAGPRAQRWRKHALQVITKLVRQVVLYKSYATQIYGYVLPCGVEENVLTIVHGYYDNYSLHHWLLCEDWVSLLEPRLLLDGECARRVGDDRVGGPTVSRQLRLIQILMRDLLIGVNYLHSHGFAHTELRLQNVQISQKDRHVKVGLLYNAAHFEASHETKGRTKKWEKVNRRQLMIAYDIRCVGIMMARMVLTELMDPSVFESFQSFLKKGNDPAGLREYLLPLLYRKLPGDNVGLQILDRNRGAGWNLLSLMLASKPSDRISCTDALRHRFLCGPKWRVESSISMTRWGIGFTAIRIVEEYIYGSRQRNRLAELVHVLELLNPNPNPENWLELIPGKWRLIYHTGRHIGLSLRQASPAVLIDGVFYNFNLQGERLSMTSSTTFLAMAGDVDWVLDKKGIRGKFEASASNVDIRKGERVYTSEFEAETHDPSDSLLGRLYDQLRRKRGYDHLKEGNHHKSLSLALPSTLPVVRLDVQDIDMTMELDSSRKDSSYPLRCIQEVRTQTPPESFDISEVVCGTYIDARLLVLRGVSGAALLFVRSSLN